MSPRVTYRLNHAWLPYLLGLLVVLQIVAPYDGWKALIAGLGAGWLIGRAWAAALARSLSLERQVRFGWTQVGDLIEERFTLHNRGDLPALWVEVIDHTRMPGYNVGRVTGVGARSTSAWRTQGVCRQRGVFTHGPTSLRTGDPLGIYTLEIHDPRQASLLVTPPVVALPAIEVAAGGQAGEGRPRPNAPERTVGVSGVRPYLPGDSLHTIHWRTTARRGEPYIRLFEGAPAGDWWIILDLNRRVQVGGGARATVEHGVILAASLADRGLRLGKPVALAANAGALAWLPPRRGDEQRWAILHSLAQVTPGEPTLAELLERMKTSFGRGASLVIITADVAGDWLKPLLRLMWSGASPSVLLLDPATFVEPPPVDAAGANLAGAASPGAAQGAAAAPEPGRAAALAAQLGELGIQHSVLTSRLLERPDARPGRRGRREVRVSPLGRAVVVEAGEEWRIVE